MLRRLLIPLCALTMLLAVPASGQAYVTGIGDQQAEMFTNPFFTPLGIKQVRYIAPYDAATVGFEADDVDHFMSAARASGAQVLVHFSHSRVSGRVSKLPSPRAYGAAVRKFLKRWPTKTVGVWNEANHCSQPTCRNPKRAAQYFLAMKKVCKGCKIVALDVLDAANIKPTLGYVKRWQRYARRGHPRIYGFHNYSDTNRFSSKRTKALLRITKGEVWLTETGGVVKFGRNFPYSEKRAAKALKYMFKLAGSNKRIRRLYIYQWTGAPAGARFDAGLVSNSGTPRPGYDVVKRKLARRR